MTDAVVIGSGPNGLVGANLLADRGWDVVVLEANDTPGGAVRTAEVTAPGFRNDLFSAFYPLAAKSPVIQGLELERWGLRWAHAPLVLAHPTLDGPSAVVSRDLDVTAGSLDRFAAGDGEVWRRLYGLWERAGTDLVEALLSPFPPVRSALRMVGSLGLRTPAMVHLGLRSLQGAVRPFDGEGGRLMMGGNAGHADIPLGSPGSALFGWMMCSLAQDVGFPSPEGGAGELIAALIRRLEDRGGKIRCGAPVAGIEVRDGRAVAVRTTDGDVTAVDRAVLADVNAPKLYRDLVGFENLSPWFRTRLRWYRDGPATVKVDWAVSEPVPWSDPDCRRAGTLHIAESFEELSTTLSQIDTGLIPARPFLLVGQMTMTDPTRSPTGTESMWAYAHVPQKTRADVGGELSGTWTRAEVERFADRMQDRIERFAPGFSNRVLARHVLGPHDLEAEDANLVGGDVGGGTAKLRQQLVLRPVPGLGRAETPIDGLYLASASAHPGGGVHGACGANAARAALKHDDG